MLYVFNVPTGTILNFDMNLAVKKVLELKAEIFNCVRIAVEDQVLLCSGGEELMSENIVGNYSGAGTDTNPIFLFSRKECSLPSSDKITVDLGLERSVKDCAVMIHCINTISVKQGVAGNIHDMSLKGKAECSELVHQQHLQQQGWAAVIANLEDAKDSLIKRKQHLDEVYTTFLENRSYYQETIKMFPEDIALLSKVPICPKLLTGSECSEEDLDTEHTLLTWFCSEPQQVLESLVEKCQQSLDNLHENSLICLNTTFLEVIEQAENSDYREVKGIEKRLSSLNHIIETTGQLCKDQTELFSILKKNDRINQAKDPNILPDVCNWYQSQLELMLKNYLPIGEMLQKCKAAKAELCLAINRLIPCICKLESDIYNLQCNIEFYEKHINSVINKIESFHQVHMAPYRYLKTLAEVCRRKEFSSQFMKWATDLSEKASKLYEKEIALRKNFSSKECKNMVDNLFCGMDDMPPSYAVELPCLFDQNLPDISRQDLDYMKSLFPQLAHLCEIQPDSMTHLSQVESDSAFSSNIPSSLKTSSLETSHSNVVKVHAKLSALQKFIQALQGSLQNDLSHLKEFVKDEMSDKMSDASNIVKKINSCMVMMQKQVLIEKEAAVDEAKKDFVSIENAYIHRLEVESQKLNDAENQITQYEEHLQACSSSLEEFKNENEQLVGQLQDKTELLKKIMLEHELEFDSHKNFMQDLVHQKDKIIKELKRNLAEILDKTKDLTVEDSCTQTCDSKDLEAKEADIFDLKEQQKSLKDEIVRLQGLIDSSKHSSAIETKLSLSLRENEHRLVDIQQEFVKFKEEAKKDKENALKELEEKLTSQHKNEIESLCSRFRLVISTTSIERPSSSPEPSSDAEPYMGLDDLKKDMADNLRKLEAEKEIAIEKLREEMADSLNQDILKFEEKKTKTIASLQSEHEEALERLKSRITAESQVSFNEAINSLAKEKDTVIEDLKSQVTSLEVKLASIKFHLQKYLPSQETRRGAMSQSHSSSSCDQAESQKTDEAIILKKLGLVFQSLLQQDITEGEILSQPPHISTPAYEIVRKRAKSKEVSPQASVESVPRGFFPCMDCKHKISIFTCNDKDLVLVHYMKKHENYSILHYGPHAHFLHSDSFTDMNLKLPLEPAEELPKFVLGIVLAKEFCITKKKENRYKVGQGTKFYRVKVRPWFKEMALSMHSTHMTPQMAATMFGSRLSHYSPPSGGAGKSTDMTQSSI